MSMGKCEKCVYWEAGLCKRYPPSRFSGNYQGDPELKYYSYIFPETESDCWCGEYKRKGEQK